MEGFIKTTKGRLKKLLSEHGNYKSLNQFRKDLYETDGVNYTDKQLNKMLIEHHNETVKEIRESLKEQNKRRRDEIKEQNKNMNHLFKNVEVQPFNKKVVTKDIITFGENESGKEILYTYDGDKTPKGFDSINITNYCIPQLRENIKKHKNIKVNLTYALEMYRLIAEDKPGEVEYSYDTFYYSIKTIEIFTIESIKEHIEKFKQNVKDNIPEIELSGSGWLFNRVISLLVSINKDGVIRGHSYIPLPEYISNKKCCINPKNEDDDYCLRYCIIYALYQNEIQKPHDRISNYKKFMNRIDWSGIEGKLTDIPKLEKQLNRGIHVWGYDIEHSKKPFILYKSNTPDDNKINLLYITKYINKTEFKRHYVYVKNINVLLKENKRDTNGKHVHSTSYFCINCIQPFSSQEQLNKHKEMGCENFEPQKIKLPSGKKPFISFKNYNNKFKAPVTIYADFETYIKPLDVSNIDKDKCYKSAELPPCGFSFNVVSQYPQLNLGLFQYRGDDAAEKFIDELLKTGDIINKHLKKVKPMIITKEQELEFNKCDMCHICEKPIGLSKKVRDHDHYNGLYRGCAHEKCNLNLKYYCENNNYQTFKTPVFFHNLKGFDGHLIIQALKKRNFSNIDIIAQNFEKYMTIKFANFRIIDSFAFLSSSLDSLSSNMNPYEESNTEKENINTLRMIYKHTSNHFKNDEQFLKVIKKGVYPYEYIDGPDKFEETKLPPINKFYSSLHLNTVDEKSYKHALEIWNIFNMKNLGEYHDLYLKTDVLLLSDVFETFRNTALHNYNLDPACNYLTLPSYSWDAMLYKTKVHLEQITDIDKYIFIERGIRGGISMITHRYAKANNKYMGDKYNPNEENSYIMNLDANNLYGGGMIEKLPISDFEFDDVERNVEYLKNFNADEEDCIIVEYDCKYPNELHDSHNSYPLAPESLNIKNNMLSPYQQNQLKIHNEINMENITKLTPNLYDKTKYVSHIKNLQYYMSKGLVVTKIHRILKCKQSNWLKEYIDFNTNLRSKAKNEFEKGFFKLMNNAVFGKTMENMRNRVSIQLYSDEDKALRQIAKPQFIKSKIYDKNLIAIQLIPKCIELNKPIYAGFAILELSKLIMYKFHYDYILEKYGDKAKLLFTDTDSLTYHIKTEDLYRDNFENKHLFDFSDYNMNDEYRKCDNTNKKVIGKMKDETNGIPIEEFVGLRSKMYSCKLINGKEKNTAKGIGKVLLKNKVITHNDYLKCININATILEQRQRCNFNTLRTFNHNIYTYSNNKVSLSCSDNKRYLLDDGITSYAYGHYKI